MPPVELTNRSVVVLGGTGALGRRISSELASRGARVTVAGRNGLAAAEIAAGIDGADATFDFLDPATHRTPIDIAEARFGSVEGIVNAAGVVAFGPLTATPATVIKDVVATNLTGPLTFYAAAIPRMNEGFILNLSGVVASMPTAGMATYSASKAGLSAATISMARELRREGITVIDAQPPHTETSLVERALAGEPPNLPDGLAADVVARRTVDGVAAGRRRLDAEWFSAVDS